MFVVVMIINVTFLFQTTTYTYSQEDDDDDRLYSNELDMNAQSDIFLALMDDTGKQFLKMRIPILIRHLNINGKKILMQMKVFFLGF